MSLNDTTSPGEVMKALCLAEDGQMALRSVPIPCPLVGEALIKVLRAGICNTDLEMAKGYEKSQQVKIIGHEFVGVVKSINSKEVGEVHSHRKTIEGDNEIQVGDRVVGEINVACEKCDVCKNGGIRKRNHCPDRTVLGIVNRNGTFAEYLTLPVSNLYRVPDDVTDQQAVFAEPFAAAFRIIEQMKFSPTDKISIIGDGKLGLLISEVLALQDIEKLVLFGHHSDKMALAPEKLEKIICTENTADDYEDYFDICVDACGKQAGIKLAGKITRPLGKVILKTTCADDKFIFNPFKVVVKEQTIIGSRCGNFRMALDALCETTKVKVDKLVSGVYPMSEAMEAFKMAAVKGTLKVQIVMDK